MKALNSVANPPELYVTTFSFKQLVFSLNLSPPLGLTAAVCTHFGATDPHAQLYPADAFAISQTDYP